MESYKDLDEKFIAIADFRDFPYQFDYPTKYKSIADYLKKWVLPYVNSGAMLNGDGYLTDHGPEHVKMVIKRASKLLEATTRKLNDYETYILLMAIQIHDVGNILGRNGHEINSTLVMKQINDELSPNFAGPDRIEWDYIYEIASSHGGKDKISKLDGGEIHVLEQPIRPQLLASILKFSDELAENSSRADRYNLLFKNIPDTSKLYHEYALALDSVIIKANEREVYMYFVVDEDKLCNKYKKVINGKTTETYLIDEIYLRTLKTHYERLYCMRFMRPLINIDRIRVNIKIRLRNRKWFSTNFDLVETGLNSLKIDDMYNLCPELLKWTGHILCEKSTEQSL